MYWNYISGASGHMSASSPISSGMQCSSKSSRSVLPASRIGASFFGPGSNSLGCRTSITNQGLVKEPELKLANLKFHKRFQKTSKVPSFRAGSKRFEPSKNQILLCKS